MKMDIHAHYLAQLTTPLDIGPSLEQLPSPIMFETTHEKKHYAVEIHWSPDDIEWNDEYGIIKTMRVDIRGKGIVLPAQIDEPTIQAYERVFVDVIRRYVTWVRVKTGQSWLDDRFAVRSYGVRFYHRDGSLIEEQSDRNPNRRHLSLHPDDAYSELSSDDWGSIAEHFTNKDAPPRLERLIAESRALLAAKFNVSSLIHAVSALEELERMWLEKGQYSDAQKLEFTERRLVERIRKIALENGLDSEQRRLLSRMISIRHDNTHKKFVEPREKDIMALIHIILKLSPLVRV